MSATTTPKGTTDSSKTAPKLSLNKQIVLDEDEYTEGLSRIIARDFFPTLHHLTATNDYLTALESRDPSLIDASARTLRELGPTPVIRSRQPQPQTPFRTPRDPSDSSGPPNKRRRIEDEMGLDEYQACFTSEDNASFTEILDDENMKRRERFKWAWDAQKKAMDGRMIEDTNRKRMLLEGAGESDARGTRNSLMFAPDADQSPYHLPPPSASPSTSITITEGIRQPKSITHTATRMPSPPPDISTSDDPSSRVPPSPTRSRIDAAIAGVRYIPASGEGGDEGAEGPNGYNYVPSLPSTSPDQLGPIALKELMTMGTLLSTPRLLSSTRDGDAAPRPDATPFRIEPPSRREQTGLKLSMKASRAIREKAAKLNGGTPGRVKGDIAPPTSAALGATPKRSVDDLTPAARALLARSTAGGGSGNKTPVRGAGSGPSSSGSIFAPRSTGPVFERDLRNVKWTPSPMTRR
ncbi:hypothetical protein FRC17_010006 [Serendipita sp. 399]|nr:hypothetical protein FRC17_010006 [Serendipita sp. 399]